MNIGVIIDNDLNYDSRVLKQINLLKKKNKVFVLCYAYPNKKYDIIENVIVHRIKINKFIKNFLFFINNRFPIYERIWSYKISNFIKKNSIDILHCHDLYMSKPTYIAKKNFNNKCKIILALHENYPEAVLSYNWTNGIFRNFISKPQLWASKEKEYLLYADKLVVISDYFRNKLLKKYNFLNKKNILTYPNLIDFKEFERFKIDYQIKKSDLPTFLYFGIIAERRGIFDVIQVFNEVLKRKYRFKLLLIGPVDKSDGKKFKDLISSSPINKYVQHIPFIKLSKLVSYLNISDVALAPFIKNKQHDSGVANKIFQYMYGRNPIIASNCKSQSLLIKQFDCGLVYSNNNDFVKKIIFFIENPEIRLRMGTNGFNNLYKKIDSEKYDYNFLSFFKI